MIGVFSEDQMPAHSMWSRIFFIFILIVLVLTSITLFSHPHPNFIKWLSYYGIILAIVDAIFVFFGLALVEWFTVFSALGFVALLVYNMFKMEFSA